MRLRGIKLPTWRELNNLHKGPAFAPIVVTLVAMPAIAVCAGTSAQPLSICLALAAYLVCLVLVLVVRPLRTRRELAKHAESTPPTTNSDTPSNQNK